MNAATRSEIEALHGAIARALTAQLQADSEPSASLLAQAISFVKMANIDPIEDKHSSRFKAKRQDLSDIADAIEAELLQ